MHQKTKDIQKRYDGFLQTNCLWKNDVVFDLHQFEIEEKYVLEMPSQNIRKDLNYSFQIENLAFSSERTLKLMKNLGFTNIKTEELELRDSIFLPNKTFQDKINEIELKRGDLLNSRAQLGIDSGDSQGFIEILKKFASSNSLEDYQRNIRYRENTGKNRYLTVKDTTCEYRTEIELELLSNERIEDVGWFLGNLGYEIDKNRSKTKIQTKFSGLFKGLECAIEFNVIPELEGLSFLEIEFLLDKKNKLVGEYISQIARNIGITTPELNIFEGGRREDRSYFELQLLLKK
jgi:hypothetical protein